MTHEIIDAIADLLWPVLVLVVVLLFGAELRAFIRRASSLKFTVLGNPVEISAQEAELTLKELMQDLGSMVADISPRERDLFVKIRASEGRRSVEELLENFERGSSDHKCLQSLRDRKMIRPFEGGSWQSDKHPVVTRFSQVLLRHMPETIDPKN